eukprot:c22480_g1_i2 orf=245-541(-)
MDQPYSRNSKQNIPNLPLKEVEEKKHTHFSCQAFSKSRLRHNGQMALEAPTLEDTLKMVDAKMFQKMFLKMCTVRKGMMSLIPAPMALESTSVSNLEI